MSQMIKKSEHDTYMGHYEVAKVLVQSSYTGTKNPNDALWIIATGNDLGLSPVQALRGIHVIKGKPVMSADMMAALAMRHPECEYLSVIEMTAERCVIETMRKGHRTPVTMIWTAEDAKRAGLSGDNWRKYPAAMLKARCMGQIVRAVYPDALLGIYAEGELERGEVNTDRVIDADYEEMEQLEEEAPHALTQLMDMVVILSGQAKADLLWELLPTLYKVEDQAHISEGAIFKFKEQLHLLIDEKGEAAAQARIDGIIKEHGKGVKADWHKANRHYRALMNIVELSDADRVEFEDYIEANHGVDSFTKVTAAQINDWIDTIKCDDDPKARAQIVRGLLGKDE